MYHIQKIKNKFIQHTMAIIGMPFCIQYKYKWDNEIAGYNIHNRGIENIHVLENDQNNQTGYAHIHVYIYILEWTYT